VSGVITPVDYYDEEGFHVRGVAYPQCSLCLHCGRCDSPCYLDDFYMVRDDIWNEVTKETGGKGRLHVKCLEQRLGRRLVLLDFTVIVWVESVVRFIPFALVRTARQEQPRSHETRWKLELMDES
jgi:hypothetical protein